MLVFYVTWVPAPTPGKVAMNRCDDVGGQRHPGIPFESHCPTSSSQGSRVGVYPETLGSTDIV